MKVGLSGVLRWNFILRAMVPINGRPCCSGTFSPDWRLFSLSLGWDWYQRGGTVSPTGGSMSTLILISHCTHSYSTHLVLQTILGYMPGHPSAVLLAMASPALLTDPNPREEEKQRRKYSVYLWTGFLNGCMVVCWKLSTTWIALNPPLG